MAKDIALPDRSNDFNNITDEICAGNYVLVLGSDIMLDPALNKDSKGDSARFFLEKIIKTRNKTYNSNYRQAENFSSFIIDNSLNSKEVKRWLLEAIRSTAFDLEDITPDLLSLLSTKFFRVVMSTVFDPSIETLMDAVWGKGNYRIKNIFDKRENNFDFKRDEIFGDEYFDIPPTLYYVFGKADPVNPHLLFSIDDNETIECISRWLGDDVPQKFLSYIDSKKLLVLGCNLKDWCFRFFWYAMRHKKANILHKGDIAVMLQPKESEQDRNLYNYLDKTLGVRIQTDSRKYLKSLSESLNIETIANTALQNSVAGGIFISYANEDFTVAHNIYNRLKQEGFKVWLDNYRLEVSDEYDIRIRNAINQCRVFIPLLSDTVAEDLCNDKERYYRKEWEIATAPNVTMHYFPVVFNYDYRAPYHRKVPERIQEVSVFDWTKEPFRNLVKKIENALNSI